MTRKFALNMSSRVQEHVAQYLQHLWNRDKKGPRRIGMAISGGVDSMALATLCKGSQSKFEFTGFIVDHGVRKDSSDEAAKVAEELSRIGIESRILKLDWNAHGNPNFEAVARKLRYQAIGKACYGEKIRSLLVGHHADDQAETVLSRIVSGYLGAGLAGIQTEAGIPECAGIYGVDGSGWDAHGRQTGEQSHTVLDGILIEQGGVNICRPLLSFTKDQLIQVCQNEEVKWFEDSTNADRTLTIRNTIRHLHASAVLPKALQRNRLCSMALVTKARTEAVQNEVDRLFDSMDVQFDLRLGKVTFTVDHDIKEKCSQQSVATVHRVKAELLRKLMQLLTNRSILLQDLKAAVDVAFSNDLQLQTMQVGKVNIQPAMSDNVPKNGHKTTVLSRQRPSASDVRALSQLPVSSQDKNVVDHTNWLLWDHRYWLRLRSKDPHYHLASLKLFVTFFTPTILGSTRKSLDKQQRATLDHHIKAAKSYGIVWTLPVIIARENDQEHAISLPSLRWQNPAFRKWYAEKSGQAELVFHVDIRYRSVDFRSSGKHQVIS